MRTKPSKKEEREKMSNILCKVTINKGPLTGAAQKEVLRLSAAIRGSIPKKGGRPEMRKGGTGWKKASDRRAEQAAKERVRKARLGSLAE